MAAELGTAGPRDPLRAIYDREQARPRRRRYYMLGAGVAILVAFVAVIIYAYHEGIRQGSESVAPLIRADQQPYKVKPENPGGMEIPNQDKLVYNEISPDGVAKPPGAERLLPPPETPLPRPTPDQAATPGSASAPAAGAATSMPLPPAPAPAADRPGAAPPAAPVAGVTSAPIATAPTQVAAVPAKAPAATTADLAGKWRVQLGALRSSEDAQRQWARLRKNHPDLLGGLALSIERVDLGPHRGVFYRMQAGPLPDKNVAAALCDRLKAVKVGCMTVKP